MIKIGIISEVQGKKARVAIGTMVTDFLPVIQIANSFSIHWKPLRVGEQVIVLPIQNELNSGVVLRAISSESFDFPHTKEDEEIVTFEDGAILSYNTSNSTLSILNNKVLNIDVKDSVNINAENNIKIVSKADVDIEAVKVNIKSTKTTIQSTDISLIGNIALVGGVMASGTNGGDTSFKISGDLEVNKLKANDDIQTSKKIIDEKGDLTNHSNRGMARD